jgi:hypothetical protein
MKTCANRDEWLGALLYRDLPFNEESQADEHLLACAACRTERDALASLIAALPEPPAVPATRRRSRLPWLAVAAAVAGVCVGFMAARMRPAPPSGIDEPPRASVRLVSPEAAAFARYGASALSPEGRARLSEWLK